MWPYDVEPEPIPCDLVVDPGLVGESSVYILRARSLRGEYFTFTLPTERSLEANNAYETDLPFQCRNCGSTSNKTCILLACDALQQRTLNASM